MMSMRRVLTMTTLALATVSFTTASFAQVLDEVDWVGEAIGEGLPVV